MYKYVCFALLASMVQFAQGSCDELKMYVKPKQVRLAQKNIIVRTKDGRFVAQNLSKDADGFFVMRDELQPAPEATARTGCCKKNRNGKFRKMARWNKNRLPVEQQANAQ